MALIQGMENANKTRVRFGRRANGGFLEGAGLVQFSPVITENFGRPYFQFGRSFWYPQGPGPWTTSRLV
jgi:hypothetical protein